MIGAPRKTREDKMWAALPKLSEEDKALLNPQPTAHQNPSSNQDTRIVYMGIRLDKPEGAKLVERIRTGIKNHKDRKILSAVLETLIGFHEGRQFTKIQNIDGMIKSYVMCEGMLKHGLQGDPAKQHEQQHFTDLVRSKMEEAKHPWSRAQVFSVRPKNKELHGKSREIFILMGYKKGTKEYTDLANDLGTVEIEGVLLAGNYYDYKDGTQSWNNCDCRAYQCDHGPTCGLQLQHRTSFRMAKPGTYFTEENVDEINKLQDLRQKATGKSGVQKKLVEASLARDDRLLLTRSTILEVTTDDNMTPEEQAGVQKGFQGL